MRFHPFCLLTLLALLFFQSGGLLLAENGKAPGPISSGAGMLQINLSSDNQTRLHYFTLIQQSSGERLVKLSEPRPLFLPAGEYKLLLKYHDQESETQHQELIGIYHNKVTRVHVK